MATTSAYASGAADFTPIIPDVLRAKVSTFVDLFVQSEQLRRSLESITVLHAALHDSAARARCVAERGRRDRDCRRAGPDRVV